MARSVMFLVFAISVSVVAAQSLPSKVYNFNELKVNSSATNDQRPILDGSTTSLDNLEIHTSTVKVGEAPHAAHAHADAEELIVVKEGTLKLTVMDKSKVLGPGSVAWIIPGDMHGLENAGNIPVTYYILKLKARAPMNAERGKKAGSIMIDWNDVVANPTEKGQRRNFYDRSTTMFERSEMHVTTLNKPGEVSHAPHTHKAEEILIIIKGKVEMQIGDGHYPASPGALIFLASMVPHALKNAGDGPCEYFAIQW